MKIKKMSCYSEARLHLETFSMFVQTLLPQCGLFCGSMFGSELENVF